jgi:hypothetical protein
MLLGFLRERSLTIGSGIALGLLLAAVHNPRYGVALAGRRDRESEMAELIHEHTTHVRAPEGPKFVARTYGEERSDGTWIGWLEFAPINEPISKLRTDRETSQPNRQALEYWSTGLEPVYIKGAFERAHLLT